jgi:hypothetical protein
MTPLQRAAHHRAEARKALAEQQAVTGAKRVRSNTEIAGTVRRFARTLGERVANGDPEDLRLLVALRADLDAAITAGTEGLLDQGRSFTEIASALGISRQAARQRYVRHTA